MSEIDQHDSVQSSHDQAEQWVDTAFDFKVMTSGTILSLTMPKVSWIEYKSKFAILVHLRHCHQLVVEGLVEHCMLLEELCEEDDDKLYDSELFLIQSLIFQW